MLHSRQFHGLTRAQRRAQPVDLDRLTARFAYAAIGAAWGAMAFQVARHALRVWGLA